MKIMYPLLSLALLVFVLCSCNKQSTTAISTPIESWNTFSAPEGFQMEYPSGWKVVENMSGARVFFLAPPKEGFSNNFNFLVERLSTAGINSLKEYDLLTATQVEEMSGGLAKLTCKRADIRGITGSQYDYRTYIQGQEMQFRQWVFIKSGEVYLFTYADRPTSFAKDEKKAERILNSFSFL